MRTLLTVTCDVTASNKAVTDGSLAKVMQSTMERIKPEAAYFRTFDGNRGCFMVFELLCGAPHNKSYVTKSVMCC